MTLCAFQKVTSLEVFQKRLKGSFSNPAGSFFETRPSCFHSNSDNFHKLIGFSKIFFCPKCSTVRLDNWIWSFDKPAEKFSTKIEHKSWIIFFNNKELPEEFHLDMQNVSLTNLLKNDRSSESNSPKVREKLKCYMFSLIYFPCKSSFGQVECSFNNLVGRFSAGRPNFFRSKSRNNFKKFNFLTKKVFCPKGSTGNQNLKFWPTCRKFVPKIRIKSNLLFLKNKFQGKVLLDMQKARSTKLQQEKFLIMQKFVGQSPKRFEQPINLSKKKIFSSNISSGKEEAPINLPETNANFLKNFLL